MTRGTYRESDGSVVDIADANAAWIDAARPALVAVASKYHAVTTYRELADTVQAATGIRTQMLLTRWVGTVLQATAQACHATSEPLLSSLCVRTDGTVGAGYIREVADAYGEVPTDVEIHAAKERLRCYEYFGADVPAGGGTAVLTPQVAKRRERAKTRAAATPVLVVCPTCNMVVPMSGTCYNCTTNA